MVNHDQSRVSRRLSSPSPIVDCVISIVAVGACTAVALLLRHHLETATFAMIYLLGVVVVSMRLRRFAAILNALLSVTAFHYFCLPFQDSFVLENSTYVLTLITMLVVALVISTLTFKIRAQSAEMLSAQIAIESERTRNSLLSAVSKFAGFYVRLFLQKITGSGRPIPEPRASRKLPSVRRM